MAKQPRHLSRREREIMDIVYARGAATAAEILEEIPDPPSYSAVRGLLRVLVEKGKLRTRKDGIRNVYHPTRPRGQEARSALRRTLETFFGGDVRQAVVALLDVSEARLTEAEIRRIEQMIEQASKEGR